MDTNHARIPGDPPALWRERATLLHQYGNPNSARLWCVPDHALLTISYYEHNMNTMNARAQQKAATRERILESAGTRMKQHGIAGASVADVMGDLGLTVGGFYAHFGSKDDLIDQALRRAMSVRTQRLRDPAYPAQWQERLRRFASRYLTKHHRDDAAGGCPMPSVVADAGRLGAGQSALTDEVAVLVDVLRGDQAKGNQEARAATLATIATCVGALTLARALGNSALSNEVLAAAQAFVDQAVPAESPQSH